MGCLWVEMAAAMVVTTLLCSAEDPQRHIVWPSDGTTLDPLLRSVRDASVVVLHDLDLAPPPAHPARLTRVTPGGNPYHHRWSVIAGWLADTAPSGWVWCVDGTDVEMLHTPWPHMVPGVLYCGSEASTWADPWVVENHPSIVGDADDRPLLNAGLVGGDAVTVAGLVGDLVADLAGCAADRTDMAAFNRCAARRRVVTGDPVHTAFRGYEQNHPCAWWRHK